MSELERLAAAVLEGRVRLEVTAQTDPRYGSVVRTDVQILVDPAPEERPALGDGALL